MKNIFRSPKVKKEIINLILKGDETPTTASRQFNISRSTVYNWLYLNKKKWPKTTLGRPKKKNKIT